MKVLIISSSLGKDGNSEVLCGRFANGASKAGQEVIFPNAFRGFIRCLPDAQEKGVIYGTGTWDKGDVYRHSSYEQAYEMGKEI